MKQISVFGSATPRPGDPDYETAQELGYLLAEYGYAVACGGYTGTMEAVCLGAKSAGGHTIGVLSDQIETIRPLGPNPYIVEQIRFPTLLERMLYLVRNNDGMIVQPGGIGTLAEFVTAWELMRVEELSPRPLILLGRFWREALDAFVQPAYIAPQHIALLSFAETPQAAVDTLRQAA